MSELSLGDAEAFPFEDNSFDIIYSWGVLHHTPDTRRAIEEVYRVLRPGGIARIMVYNRYSVVGYVLWLRYALLAGHVDRSLDYIYHHYLESPGTKAYSIDQARLLLSSFSHANYRIQLSFGDLLQGAVGQRHTGVLLGIAKRCWPRWFIRRFCKNSGLYLMIEAVR